MLNKQISQKTYNTILTIMLVSLGIAIAALFITIKNSYEFHRSCDGIVVTKSYQSKQYCVSPDALKGK